jgi:glycosyltransferase involved in cell wall biosynthesis
MDLLYSVVGLLGNRVVVSSAAVQARFPAWCRPKIDVVHNGVDLLRFRPAVPEWRLATRLSLGIPSHAPVAIFIGRLAPWKGALFYLDVCAAVALAVPDAHFLLVGSRLKGYKQHVTEIEQRAARSDLQGRVHILYDQQDVVPLLQAADVFVHTSQRPEPFGIVLIEAMACGLAVVAAHGGGVGEIDGGSGALTLVDAGDRVGYIREVSALLVEPQARRSAGSRARRRAGERFAITRATAEIMTILEGVAPRVWCREPQTVEVRR